MTRQNQTMPLSGLRVAELGCLPAGAFCARMFADFGADVIKVEPPQGDPGRALPPLVDIGRDRRESGYFGFLNVGKRSVVVDPADAAAVKALGELLRGADVLIDSASAAERAALGLDHAALRDSNPDLVIVSLSWFGESGPYRDFRATDLVCRAVAGLVQLIGPQQGPPVPLPDFQAGPVGGLTAFIAASAALLSSGTRGRRFEVSVMEATMALADYNVALAWTAGERHKRWGVNKFAPNYPLGIYRCKKGWIGVTVVTPVQWKGFCQLLGLDDLIGDPAYATNRDRLPLAELLEARFAPRFLERTAQEWFAIALEQRLPFVVVPDMADLLTGPAYRRAGTFVPIRHGERSYEAPGSPLRLIGTPPRQGGDVPALGAGRLAWSRDALARTVGARVPAAPAGRPLAGVRVVDLAMGWAGPQATRHLADLGADVIKIEACQYPDWWRGVDNRPIVIEQMLYEKSGYFNVLNRSKRGITLDLTTADGVRLVKELVRDADLVIENYSVGVLPKLGLDYDSLRAVNPSLIMASMPAFPAESIWCELRAYGSTLEQASGLPSVSGDPNGPPAMNHIAYGDPVGGLHATAALLIALMHKRRTGEGQRIDLSQVECMFSMVAPWIIEQSANGTVAPRLGGRHAAYVPHGCFPCDGEEAWVQVAVTDDAMWRGLCEAIGRTDLADDASLVHAAGRRAREDEIEAAIAAWTRRHGAEDAMVALQRHGVAAGIARPPLDLLEDPHLVARGFWQWIERPFVGRHAQPSPAYREHGAPYPIERPAPTLGQHNEEVLRGLLGVSDAEIRRLTSAGVIGTQAVPPNLRKARAATG